jgi:hypothetical protein
MASGDVSGENEASGCSGSGVRKSNVTSRISSIREAWTGYVRGLEDVHKKLLIQAACNLALLMRSIYGAGRPRADHEQAIEAVFCDSSVYRAITSILEPWCANSGRSGAWGRIGLRIGRMSTGNLENSTALVAVGTTVARRHNDVSRSNARTRNRVHCCGGGHESSVQYSVSNDRFRPSSGSHTRDDCALKPSWSAIAVICGLPTDNNRTEAAFP